MMGLDTDCKNDNMSHDAGIIPRFCHEVFQRIKSLDTSRVTTTAEISYFEIYNEKIHDLLGGATAGSIGSNAGADASGRRPPLKVREHPQDGPYVVDLSVHGVESYSDIQVKHPSLTPYFQHINNVGISIETVFFLFYRAG